MQAFSAEYSFRPSSGTAGSGPCSVVVEGPGINITPRGSASMPIRFTEIAAWSAEEYTVTLTLADGAVLELSRLARRFDELVALIKESRRSHFLKALLLEETGETAVETGAYRLTTPSGTVTGACSIHLQRTSLACFPDIELPFLVPYGSVIATKNDSENYGTLLECDDGAELLLFRFARRTDCLAQGIEERREALARRQSSALAGLAPDQGAVALHKAAQLLRDGVPASRQLLDAAVPGVWDALWQFGFNEERRCYADILRSRSTGAYVAIKEIAGRSAADDEGRPAALADRQLLYLFEIQGHCVIEAPSTDEAATYVFSIEGESARFIRTLCRTLAAVQFRREPLYLPLAALAQPPHDRYAEAVRILPGLRAARTAFCGRAIHRSPESWQQELDTILSGKT